MTNHATAAGTSAIACLLLSIPLMAGPSITLPLAFERNAGQTDPQVKFDPRPGWNLWFTEQGPVLGVAENRAPLHGWP